MNSSDEVVVSCTIAERIAMGGPEMRCGALDPLPLDAVETTNGFIGESVEGAGGEVEVEHGTAGAAVHGHNLDGLALV